MGEILDAIIDAAISMHGLAVLAGLIASWAGTQTAKKHWHFGGQKASITALVLGFGLTYLIWPGWGPVAIGAGLVVGLAAPGAYKIAVALARKKWPHLADVLSGDEKR